MSQPALAPRSSKLAMSKLATPKMSLEVTSVEQVSQTLAGVVAVDGGTIGLDVSFGAFLAVILGLFIPVVFLVTLCASPPPAACPPTLRLPPGAPPPCHSASASALPKLAAPRRRSFIQSDAQGTATTFRQPDSIGGTRFEDE